MSESFISEQPPSLTATQLKTANHALAEIAASRVSNDGEVVSEEYVSGITTDGTLVVIDYFHDDGAYVVRAGSISALAEGSVMAECKAVPDNDSYLAFHDGTTFLNSDLGSVYIPSKFAAGQLAKASLADKDIYPLDQAQTSATVESNHDDVSIGQQVAGRGLLKWFRRK